MFAYNAGGVTDRSGELMAQGANNAAMLQMQAMNNIGKNLAALGAMYGQYRKEKNDKKATLKGMDQTMGAMSDMGVLPKGFLKSYNQLDDETRPFIFQALASPMFQSYQKKQGYQDYAEAMKGIYGSKASPDSDIFEY